MSGLVFYVALRSEAASVRLGVRRARLVRFGMGGPAAKKAASLAGLEDATVVLLGFSGALGDDLGPGDLVVATSLSSVGDDERFPLSSAKQVATALQNAGLTTSAAPIVTAPRLVVGREAREKAASGGAIAVDLESRYFAPLCATRELVVVRAIVDVPDREVRSLATPLAAMRAGWSLARAARVLERGVARFEIHTQNEQAGDS